MPSIPSSSTLHMGIDHDEFDNTNSISSITASSKRRHHPQDTLDPYSSAIGATTNTASISAHHRLSFPSLNDPTSSSTASTSSTSSTTLSTTTAMATPLIATVPPENYTPLTLKSVRAAKSRNKLRQQGDPQIGVATNVVTGTRRNSLSKSTFTTTSSGGNEGGLLPGLSPTPPPPVVNHLPPLPTTPSPSSHFSSSDNPEMSSLLNSSPGRRRATSPSILSPLHSLPTDPFPSSTPSTPSSSRRRESSIASTSGLVHMPIVMPRPILKDTSARDKMRESWMSEVPGITISGTSVTGSSRSVAGGPSYSGAPGSSPSPVAPPKSLARTNSAGAKRQPKANRLSATASELDQDVFTPRHRQTSGGYGPDHRPRRQSGGSGHLLFGLDASGSGTGFESEEYEDSEFDDREELYSKHLQDQYARLQKSQLYQTSMDDGVLAAMGSKSTISHNHPNNDTMSYLAKRGQRKSLGDELDVPPVPEKSTQRKRVLTMDATTLPVISSSLVSALTAANNGSGSTSETLSSVTRSQTNGQIKSKERAYGGGAIGGGSIGGGGNSLSFEPLFALKDSGSDRDSRLLSQGTQGGTSGNRLSEVSDADWSTAMLTIDPNQQGVSIMDLSKRGLTEVPSGLPSTITHLRLAYNLVQILTPITSLTALNHLQVLDLCDNQLEILPPELGLLTRLKELYLSNNKLYKLPDTIQRMARLEVLDIRNNQFCLLNPVVGRLKALRQLDVRNNQLKSLPPMLYMLHSTLTLLLVDGNQFVQPFSDLLQPLMSDDTESQVTASARQSYLGDDPYGDTGASRKQITVVYEPWRRSVAPGQHRRGNGGPVPVLVKRRSHGDLMTLMGLQKRDGSVSTDDLLSTSNLEYNRSSTISSASGAYIAASMAGDGATTAATRRERSVSTSNLTPVTEIHGVVSHPSPSSSSPHHLSFNKLFKSIRKGNKTTLKDNNTSNITIVSTKANDPKRYSLGSEVDPSSMGDLESEVSQSQDQDAKPNSRGSNSNAQGISRRATSGGINKWVKNRFHKRTNSNELGDLQANNASVTSLHSNIGNGQDIEGQPTRDSGYGAISTSGSNTPEPSRIIGSRHQNKSTGHLPSGSPLPSRDSVHQLSSSFDPSQRRERDYRYSYMSIESQATQFTENDFEPQDLDAALQQHRLSSVHSPTTPLPSSPIMGLSVNQSSTGSNNWSAASPRYGQSAAHIKPLMQYLKDLYDLDPDSSEWEEVYSWRRVWNAERAAPAGLGGSNISQPAPSSQSKGTDEAEIEDQEQEQEQLAKSEEVRLAKQQAQASRRRRIIEEIITTERTYVEGLKGLVEIYLNPAVHVMSPGDHKKVFSSAQQIYIFHSSHFLPELEKAFSVFSAESTSKTAADAQQNNLTQVTSPVSPVPSSTSQFVSETNSVPSSATSSSAAMVSDAPTVSDNQQQQQQSEAASATDVSATPAVTSESTASKPVVEDRIGRIFVQSSDYMKMYSLYVNGFDNALRVLQTLQTGKNKKKMKEFLRRCSKHPNHTQLALQGYLLLPVQRIPRYKLLLQDLLENTWTDHVDYQDIATALEKISTRADEMNERKREYENHEKVLLIQNRIIGQYKTPLVQPHRKVVREGMLHLIRVVTRNVSMMGLDSKSTSSTSSATLQPQPASTGAAALASAPSAPVGDMTVHHLSEETIEKSFLFILFNDIMIQCNQIAGKSGSSGTGGGIMSMHNGSSVTLGSSAGTAFSSGGMSSGSGGAGGDSGNAIVKDLELQRVLQLESRLHPAEVIGNDVLRVVDDTMVLYLTGDKDVIQAWKDDINSRW
ncbi:hypothetical protein FBU30_008297 [Linnemannia zychae]|nr:hypothetical protein FBU30_008297 [Linnemannia zychae]